MRVRESPRKLENATMEDNSCFFPKQRCSVNVCERKSVHKSLP